MTVICPVCSHAIPTEARFCSACGQAITAESSAAQHPFVGRRRELEILQAKLKQALAGQGCLVIVAGEAGIGKTSLMQEFATQARQWGVAVLWGACFEGKWRLPYGPWVDALGEYIDQLEPERLRHCCLGLDASPLA